MYVTDHKSEKGGSLFLVIAIVVGFGLMGAILSKFVIGESQIVSIHLDKQKAFYVAESGINYAVGMLSDRSGWRNTTSNISVGDGAFSISVDDNSTIAALDDTLLVTSVATTGLFAKTVQARLIIGWTNVAYAGNDLDFSTGKGNIDGNIHANDKATLGNKYTISGNVTEAPPNIELPVIDWNFYMNEAVAAGQYVVGDKEFTSGGSPYSGIWYVTEDISIKHNGVILNGSLVAEGNIEIKKNDVEIYATPTNYPALISGNDLEIDMNNTIIEGLIYSDNDIILDKNNGTFKGAIIAKNSITHTGNNLEIILDPKYTTSVLGMIIPGSAISAQVVKWEEK
jgi:cytoskeletal protein CcmA (bactofilin family)